MSCRFFVFGEIFVADGVAAATGITPADRLWQDSTRCPVWGHADAWQPVEALDLKA